MYLNPRPSLGSRDEPPDDQIEITILNHSKAAIERQEGCMVQEAIDTRPLSWTSRGWVNGKADEGINVRETALCKYHWLSCRASILLGGVA